MSRVRKVRGFYDLGPVRVPPLPRKWALTDRSNGNIYEIVKADTAPALALLSSTDGYTVRGVFDGPFIQDGAKATRRLFATGGSISSEAVSFRHDDGPILITVAVAPLDVWSVVWDAAAEALSLEEQT